MHISRERHLPARPYHLPPALLLRFPDTKTPPPVKFPVQNTCFSPTGASSIHPLVIPSSLHCNSHANLAPRHNPRKTLPGFSEMAIQAEHVFIVIMS
jgi:hypothetical protein